MGQVHYITPKRRPMSPDDITTAIAKSGMTHREIAYVLTAALLRPINPLMVTAWKTGSQPVPADITPDMFA